jgi:predicted DNA-binding transcriptional regulator YafY
MPKGPNQKLKLLYLQKILLERTDETHYLTMKDIQAALAAYGIEAERKSLYDDWELLRKYGLDVISEPYGREWIYYIGSREFELAELKLLVDAVQASKFITVKKSASLIKKLGGLTSESEASQLQRQVYVADRVKTMNESIYYNVDIIHSAIGSNVKIRFLYTQWTVNKVLAVKKDGEDYEVSPWALSWDSENYYLVAYDSKAGIIKHYRVDKMMRLALTEERREGRQYFEKFNMGSYSSKMFGMYHGEDETVRLRFANDLAGVVIDRFGQDVALHPDGAEHFTVAVNVAVSSQFIAWVVGLGEGAQILGPAHVVKRMKETIQTLKDIYS